MASKGSMAGLILTKENFESEVLKADKLTLVDFWAVWCGPCTMVEPIVDTLTEEYKDKLKVGKVNVDDNPDISGTYGVMSIPTLLLFKNGQPVETIIGVQPKQAIEDKIKRHL